MSLVLRQGPVSATRDGQPFIGTALAILDTDRLRLFTDTKPEPTVVLDVTVLEYDLQLGKLPRDRQIRVDTPEAVFTLIPGQGGCACSGGGLLRGWNPDA